MFCGWRLLWSYPALERLGSGILEINVLERTCRYNEQAIPKLTIADELHAWILRDIAALGESAENLRGVVLRAKLSLRDIDAAERKTRDVHMGPDQRPLKQREYIACAIECESEIVTSAKVYRSHYLDLEEWPRGWRAGEADQK
jgi:hypothetical protein